MTQPIDIAYVELEARGEEDAARDIKKALDKIHRDVKKLSEQIEAEFSQAGRDIEEEMEQAGSILTKEAVRQRLEWKKTGTALSLAMKEASESAENSVDNFADEAVRDMNRITSAAVRAAIAVKSAGRGSAGGGGGGGGGGGRDINLGGGRDFNQTRAIADGLSGALRGVIGLVSDLADALSEKLGNAARQAGQSLGALVGTIASVAGPIGSLIASFGLLGAAIMLMPLIIPLIAALAQLSGLLLLLPGTIGFLVAAIAPLIMAFKGVGAAVSALASGDLEQIDKAMQDISPQARKFAVEVFGLRGELKKLKFAVQDAFFEKFNGSLRELVTRLMPTLSAGLSRVSGSLGQLGADLTDTLSSSKAISTLNDLFATTGRIIDDLRGPLMSVIDSLLGGMKASLPFVERMFKSLGDGMEKFANWLNAAVEDGRFEDWLESAFSVAKDVWELLKSIGRLMGAVFGDLGDDGQTFIEDMTAMVDKLTKWFESPEGKKKLQELVDGMKDASKAAQKLVDAILAVSRWFAEVEQDWEDFKQDVEDGKNAIVGFFDSAWEKVKSAGQAIGDFFGKIGTWFGEAKDTVAEKGEEILQWFRDLPDKISEWLSQLPGRVSTFFKETMDSALYNLGYGLGMVVQFFIDLPGRIMDGLNEFWTTVTKWFNDTRDSVVETVTDMWNNVVDWFERLPGRVSRAVSDIVESVQKWFRQTRDRVTNTARSLVNSVIEFFQKLPGRAASAIRDLPGKIRDVLDRVVTGARNAGREVMEGVAKGIRNGWNSAINAAQDAAGKILKGFWDALDINSPSKLMMREVGMPIMEGVGKGITKGEGYVTDRINAAVTRTTSKANTHAESRAIAETQIGTGGGITIQSLTIPINGTFDLSNPAGTRAVAMQIYQALEQLQKEYR